MVSRFSLSVVTVGALLLSVSSLLSRVMGVLRDFVFAQTFGVGAQGGIFALDAYYVAFKIPDLLYVLLIFGAMSAAFIPFYTQITKHEGKEEAFAFASAVLRWLFLFLVGLSLLCYLLSPWLVPFLAKGYSKEVQELAVQLTRILLLSPLFLGLSGILQGIENAHKRFFGAALAPLLYNGSIIAAAYFYAPHFGVYALAWGAVLGTVLHFLVQVPGAIRTGFHFSWKARSAELRKFFALMLPRLFGLSAAQGGILFHTFLCSLLPLGSLSIYNYAFNLQSIVFGVVAVSLSTAVFSTLAEQADTPELFSMTLRRSFSTIWFWVLPATVGLFLLREPVVDLILKGGNFDFEAAQNTAQTLGVFVWAALPLSFVPVLSRAFYSLRETWLPAAVALVALVSDVLVASWLILILDRSVEFLPYADLMNATVNALFLGFFLLRRTKTSLSQLLDWRAWGKTTMAVFGMVVVILLLPDWRLQFVLGAAAYFLFQVVLNAEFRGRLKQKIFA